LEIYASTAMPSKLPMRGDKIDRAQHNEMIERDVEE
jgi:hypothetical protein